MIRVKASRPNHEAFLLTMKVFRLKGEPFAGGMTGFFLKFDGRQPVPQGSGSLPAAVALKKKPPDVPATSYGWMMKRKIGWFGVFL